MGHAGGDSRAEAAAQDTKRHRLPQAACQQCIPVLEVQGDGKREAPELAHTLTTSDTAAESAKDVSELDQNMGQVRNGTSALSQGGHTALLKRCRWSVPVLEASVKEPERLRQEQLVEPVESDRVITACAVAKEQEDEPG